MSEEGFGALLPQVRVRPPGPASRALADRLARVESRNVTYRSLDFPVFWSEARGANVRDADGNRYLDLTAAFGVAAAGHAHPRIREAIRAQAGLLVHGMGDVHPPVGKVELLERLQAMAPWPDARIVLASSGSEAVEIALKTAQLATGRRGAIAFEGGYHGLTLGALSVTAREDFRAPFRERLPGGIRRVPFPTGDSSRPQDEPSAAGPRDPGHPSVAGPRDPGHPSPPSEPVGREGALAALERALEAAAADGDPVGCVIVEPVQGRAGVRVPPPGFLAGVAERARAAGALLVYDEIFTGFGRTGRLFALEHDGVVPDLLCVGKALGGGLPLSACLGPRAVLDAWPPSPGEALHTSTFLGHPLSCAAALAFLEVLEEEGLADRAAEEGGRLLALLREALDGSESVREVRGQGLLVGVELGSAGAGVRVAEACLRKGLLVLPAGERGEVVELSPPLTTTRPQLEWGARTLAEVIRGA